MAGKMEGMTVQERLEDISSISGLSVDVCRRVLQAERASSIKSLRKGERVNLIGRVTLRPYIKKLTDACGNIKSEIRIKAQVATAFDSEFKDLSEFEVTDTEEETKDSGIRLRQISALL